MVVYPHLEVAAPNQFFQITANKREVQRAPNNGSVRVQRFEKTRKRSAHPSYQKVIPMGVSVMEQVSFPSEVRVSAGIAASILLRVFRPRFIQVSSAPLRSF